VVGSGNPSMPGVPPIPGTIFTSTRIN
jgi:hypothetical protein